MARAAYDDYQTPEPVAEFGMTSVLRSYVLPNRTLRVLEPSAGRGNILRAATDALARLGRDVHGTAYEVQAKYKPDLGRSAIAVRCPEDFLVATSPLMGAYGGERFDLVVGNPPFLDAQAFVMVARSLLAPGGLLVFLLGIGFLASAERDPVFNDQAFPLAGVFPLRCRPSFTGDNAHDMRDVAWFVWSRGTAMMTGGQLLLGTTIMRRI